MFRGNSKKHFHLLGGSRCAWLTRSISLAVTAFFLFPILGWTFEVETYGNGAMGSTRALGPGSQSLAAEFTISPAYGTVMESHFSPGGLNLILIQDLHCNYEIQGNIRRILNQLLRRHPDIRLIAGEGASGIIPTRELWSLPDSPAKRAVADYFMREGKLTGADVTAISDSWQVELFGAENSVLYDRSLQVIQEYLTDENQGLISEIHALLNGAEAEKASPAFRKFEQKRRAFLQGNQDAEAFHYDLAQTARTLNLPLFPPELENARYRRLDFFERENQDQFLENQIRRALAKTAEDKQLLQYRQFVEVAERLLNVSASREDVLAYQAQKESLSITTLLPALQKLGADVSLFAQEDIAGLEASLNLTMEFYDLAEKRNQALFESTVRRALERKDKTAVLITGGYHTPAIAKLAKEKGYSYLVIRPGMTKAETETVYFDLLRDPERPTELEKIAARSDADQKAISPRNSLMNSKFVQAIKNVIQNANLPNRVKNILFGGKNGVVPGLVSGFRTALGWGRSHALPMAGILVAGAAGAAWVAAVLGATTAAVPVAVPALAFATLAGMILTVFSIPDARRFLFAHRRAAVILIVSIVIVGCAVLPGCAAAAVASDAVVQSTQQAAAAHVPGVLDGMVQGLKEVFSFPVLDQLKVYSGPLNGSSIPVLATSLPILLMGTASPVTQSLMQWIAQGVGNGVPSGTERTPLYLQIGQVYAQMWQARLETMFGKLDLSRATATVSEEMIKVFQQVRIRLGFKNIVKVVTSTKGVEEPEGYIQPPQVSTIFPFLTISKDQRPEVRIVFPELPGNPKELTTVFAKGIIRVFIGSALKKVFWENPYKKQDGTTGAPLRDVVKVAGDHQTLFNEIFKAINADAKNIADIANPAEIQEIVNAVYEFILYHEGAHVDALRVPDEDIDQADGRMEKSERERRKKFSIQKLAAFYKENRAILVSDFSVRNATTALVMGDNISRKAAEDFRSKVVFYAWALEIFCDRFAMFTMNTALKMRVLEEAGNYVGPESNYLYASYYLEDFLSGGEAKLKARLLDRFQKPEEENQRKLLLESYKLFFSMIPEQTKKAIFAKFKEIDAQHIMVRKFNNPALFPEETEMYREILDLSKYVEGRDGYAVDPEKWKNGWWLGITRLMADKAGIGLQFPESLADVLRFVKQILSPAEPGVESSRHSLPAVLEAPGLRKEESESEARGFGRANGPVETAGVTSFEGFDHDENPGEPIGHRFGAILEEETEVEAAPLGGGNSFGRLQAQPLLAPPAEARTGAAQVVGAGSLPGNSSQLPSGRADERGQAPGTVGAAGQPQTGPRAGLLRGLQNQGGPDSGQGLGGGAYAGPGFLNTNLQPGRPLISGMQQTGSGSNGPGTAGGQNAGVIMGSQPQGMGTNAPGSGVVNPASQVVPAPPLGTQGSGNGAANPFSIFNYQIGRSVGTSGGAPAALAAGTAANLQFTLNALTQILNSGRNNQGWNASGQPPITVAGDDFSTRIMQTALNRLADFWKNQAAGLPNGSAQQEARNQADFYQNALRQLQFREILFDPRGNPIFTGLPANALYVISPDLNNRLQAALELTQTTARLLQPVYTVDANQLSQALSRGIINPGQYNSLVQTSQELAGQSQRAAEWGTRILVPMSVLRSEGIGSVLWNNQHLFNFQLQNLDLPVPNDSWINAELETAREQLKAQGMDAAVVTLGNTRAWQQVTAANTTLIGAVNRGEARALPSQSALSLASGKDWLAGNKNALTEERSGFDPIITGVLQTQRPLKKGSETAAAMLDRLAQDGRDTSGYDVVFSPGTSWITSGMRRDTLAQLGEPSARRRSGMSFQRIAALPLPELDPVQKGASRSATWFSRLFMAVAFGYEFFTKFTSFLMENGKNLTTWTKLQVFSRWFFWRGLPLLFKMTFALPRPGAGEPMDREFYQKITELGRNRSAFDETELAQFKASLKKLLLRFPAWVRGLMGIEQEYQNGVLDTTKLSQSLDAFLEVHNGILLFILEYLRMTGAETLFYFTPDRYVKNLLENNPDLARKKSAMLEVLAGLALTKIRSMRRFYNYLLNLAAEEATTPAERGAIFELLSKMDTFNQTTVQIVFPGDPVLITSLPKFLLKDPVVQPTLLENFQVFKADGMPIAPVQPVPFNVFGGAA